MIEFFIGDCALLLLALIIIPFLRKMSRVNRIGHFMVAGAMGSGFVFTLQAFFHSTPLNITLFSHPSFGLVALRFDTLSLFFLGIIQCGGIVSSIYGIGYLAHYEQEHSLKPTLTAAILLFFSMQIVVAANHVFLFLVAWEIMALAGYSAIVLEREKKDVQQGSFIFFAATHAGTLFLYLMFLVFHQQAHSWELSAFSRISYIPATVTTLFWFGFIGFGMKAGFMPFHFWLPEAHPAAPSHISAILSAVMLKIGIYGLIRVVLWTRPMDYLLPSFLLAISCVTAVFGIWNALAQKDLKRMLAYSSIENIGIIGIGLSLLMYGMQNHQPLLTFLGLAGVLYHTVNHFVFKSLLFMSAGTIYHHFHHRNIERMGGIIHSAPVLASLMLAGSAAICGLPPLNGFASEFIIYSGIFEASRSLQVYFPFFMLLTAVILAFVGGLAVVGFSKVFSMIFLGSPKESSHHAFHISRYELASLSILTLLVVVLGIFPHLLIHIIEGVFLQLFPFYPPAVWQQSAGTIQMVGTTASASILFIAVFMILKMKYTRRRKIQVSAAWGCGYANIDPRMQYSGTSFSDDVVNIAGKALTIKKIIRLPKNPLPTQSSFSTRAADLTLYKIILPAGSALAWSIEKFKWLQSGKIQVYVAFSIAIVLFYVFLAFKL